MPEKIIMPQGGQDITEGRVLRWHKAEGDPIEKDEVICEVETEKAVFEVVAPFDGVLLKIVVPGGKIAKVFSTIAIVGQAGESVDGEDADSARQERQKQAAGIDMAALKKKAAAKRKSKKDKVKASGRARKLADQKGVDISKVKGSGPKGRIVEKDILNYIETSVPGADPDVAAAVVSRTDAVPIGNPDLRGKTVPMSRMRKVIARRLQQSKQTIPHFYVTVTVDMTEAIKQREAWNARAEKEDRISLTDMVIKAAAIALDAFPQVNCKVDEETIVYLEDINIGVAVSMDEGLMVPVLSAVDSLSLTAIAKKTKELVRLTKAGKQASLAAGSFTVSNMGMLNVDNFVAIINPPETAILAVGSVRKSVVVAEDNSFRIGNIMSMTLSADHRAVDGALGSQFVNRIKHHLEIPHTLQG